MNTQPQNPIQAVTHPDPSLYYRDLAVSESPYFDETLNMHVASSAAAVTAILTDDCYRVRPPAEPVPKALLNSPAGDIFQYLVRMNEGPLHAALKPAISAVLADVHLAARCDHWAEKLASSPAPATSLAFHLPTYVIGDLLGIPEHQLPMLAEWAAAFVGGLSPLADADQLVQGNLAAAQLLTLFRSPSARLFSHFAAHADQDAVIANAIGFLSQAYEATAALIGSTFLALSRQPDILARVQSDASLLPNVIAEVLRYDSPVQNTRRYSAEDGHAVLVVLAAANHDPAANPDPERFDMQRANRQIYTFGIGAHACPGQNLALAISEAAVRRWLILGASIADFSYQPSVNVRLPHFEG